MTSLQLHSFFPRINLTAIIISGPLMYFAIVKMKLHIVGYLIGFSTRFAIEICLEIFYICRHFPKKINIKELPSLYNIKKDFIRSLWFSLVYVLGYGAEFLVFETVPFILFQSKSPTRNVALWMSLYQAVFICNHHQNHLNIPSGLSD
jgi:hypothetical protein